MAMERESRARVDWGTFHSPMSITLGYSRDEDQQLSSRGLVESRVDEESIGAKFLQRDEKTMENPREIGRIKRFRRVFLWIN